MKLPKSVLKSVPFVAAMLLMLVPSISAQRLPEAVGFVNDFANVIDAESERMLTSISVEVRKKTGAEIAVVTVDTFAPFGSIEEYANEILNDWGIGEKEKDNGVLLIVAMKERKMRIEVGYGLEGAIPDGRAGEIRDKAMGPYFSNGNFGKGFVEGAKSVAKIIAEEYKVTLGSFDTSRVSSYTPPP